MAEVSPPAWLDEDALDIWRAQWPRCSAFGHLSEVHATLFAMFCTAQAERARLLTQIRRENLTSSPDVLDMLRELDESIEQWKDDLELRPFLP